VGNELGTVVRADERRRRVEAGQGLQHCRHFLGLAVPVHMNGQAKAAVLVHHVEELEPPPIGGGI
jgi:hypothetical protein